MEIVLLADSLQESLDELGPNDPFVKAALGGRTPAEAAKQVIEGTRLKDPAYRKELVEGGPAAVDGSDDPAIVLARKIDPIVREIQKWMEDNVESVMTSAGEKIGQARFAVYGKTRISRCHLHTAPVLRHRQRLCHERNGSASQDDFLRTLRPEPRFRWQSSLQSACPLH